MRKVISLASAAVLAGGLTLASASFAAAAGSLSASVGSLDKDTNVYTLMVSGCETADGATSLQVGGAVSAPGTTATVQGTAAAQSVTVTCTYYNDSTNTNTVTVEVPAVEGYGVIAGTYYTQDEAQTPIAGGTITLYDANGKVLKTTTSDSEGHFSFGMYADGTYYLTATDGSQTIIKKVTVTNGVVKFLDADAIPGQPGETTTTGGGTTGGGVSSTSPGLASTGGESTSNLVGFVGFGVAGLVAAGAGAVAARRK